MLHNCKLIDTTLREGEQTTGVLFTLEEKYTIIDKLVAVGIGEVELGIASPLSTCLPSLTNYCRTHHPKLTTSVWSRCKPEDIEYCAKLSPDIISLSLPASDLHIKEKLQKDRDWIFTTLTDSIQTAKRSGLQKVSVGFEDSIRADPDFIVTLARVAEKAGAFRIRIADTVGTASPGQIGNLVNRICTALTNCEIAVHTHNDFGMATANAIAGLENGANWADVTVLGLGERCGCARLEELAGYLRLVAGHMDFHPDRFRSLAEYVANLCSLTISKNRPVLGESIFTCETGLHLHGLQKNPETYEPYAPEKIGLKRKLLFGAKTGRKAIAQHLDSLHIAAAERQIDKNMRIIRRKSEILRRPLNKVELAEIFNS